MGLKYHIKNNNSKRAIRKIGKKIIPVLLMVTKNEYKRIESTDGTIRNSNEDNKRIESSKDVDKT